MILEDVKINLLQPKNVENAIKKVKNNFNLNDIK